MQFRKLSLGTKTGLVASLILSPVVIGSSFLHFDQPALYTLLVFLTILFIGGGCFFLSWRFVDRPIKELMRVMEKAPDNDFLQRAPVRSEDVIGKLSQSFNLLLGQITTLDAFKMETDRQRQIIEKTNQKLEVRLKELSLIHDFSLKIGQTLELDELYDIVDPFLGETLGFKEFAFLVLDEASAKLVVKVARGFFDPSKVLGMSFRPREGVTGRVWVEGESCYIPDTSQKPEYLHYKGEKIEDGSFLSIPLLSKKKVVGVLNLFHPGTDSFSPEERKFLKTLASELAIALVNAKLYSKTRELSVRDELTQIYNRRHFQEVLPLEIKRAQRFDKPFSILMIDIDYFKGINDRYGHLVGDACLKEFVHLVNSKIREVDFFARFGGEEFVLILSDASKEDAKNVAEKIRQLVKDHPFYVGDQGSEEHLTVSLGVAAYPEDGVAMEDLIDSADINLYRAKQGGRNQVVVSESSPEEGLSSRLH